MTKSLFAFVLSSFLGIAIGAASAQAADKAPSAAAKEVSVKGTMMCAKCSLKETTECQNVLKVAEGGKDVMYYLVQNAVAKGGHGKVCGATATATVKGTVGTVGDKKMLTASAIKYE